MSRTKKKICVVTGTRAEYGLLFWLMKAIDADPALQLQLIVIGSHLSEKHGHTVDVIERDGFNISARVDMVLDDDSPVGIAKSMGYCLHGVADALAKLQPDIFVVLGDRYEILAATEAALICGMPIAHIHGGEITEGAIDDAMRHAITKMSTLHFTATEQYRQRIIQMGEHPDSIFTVGAPGLDCISQTKMMPRAEISSELGIDVDTPYFMITMHPATRSNLPADAEIIALLTALEAFSDHALIFTGVNADTGGDAIAGHIDAFVASGKFNAQAFKSLGQTRYLSALKHADVVIGNSSSGIIEAPSLKVPTVNIGDRQKGRLRAASIIDCVATPAAITSAITKSLHPAFRELGLDSLSPYGEPGACMRIKDVLASHEPQFFQAKSFYDLPGIGAVP